MVAALEFLIRDFQHLVREAAAPCPDRGAFQKACSGASRMAVPVDVSSLRHDEGYLTGVTAGFTRRRAVRVARCTARHRRHTPWTRRGQRLACRGARAADVQSPVPPIDDALALIGASAWAATLGPAAAAG